MPTNTPPTIVQDGTVSSLQAILHLLHETLERFRNKVDKTCELTKVGALTELLGKIGAYLSNPEDSLLKASNNIDSQLRYVIDKYVQSFLRQKREVIDAAYKTKAPLNDLSYYIVLNRDNLKNRRKIFSFFDQYDLLDISFKYPIYFQFVPKELVSKINHIEEVVLN